MGLHSRLAEKEHEKRVLERDLAACEETYEFISGKREILDTDIYEPDKAYDMTSSGEWLGKLEQDADDHRNKNCSMIGTILGDTSRLLANLQSAMERIRELIRECEEEIESLEEEIRARERSAE